MCKTLQFLRNVLWLQSISSRDDHRDGDPREKGDGNCPAESFRDAVSITIAELLSGLPGRVNIYEESKEMTELGTNQGAGRTPVM